jgi:hypothetical protein
MCAKRFRGNVMNATAGASAIQARAMSAANEHVPSVHGGASRLIHAGVPSAPGPEKSTQWITLPSQHT